jgi:glycosyltransferase involved in cell wall biosynthesis
LINYLAAKSTFKVIVIIQGKSKETFYNLSNQVDIIFYYSDFNSYLPLKQLNRIVFIRKILKSNNIDVVLSFGEIWNNITLISAINLKLKIIVADRSQPNKKLPFFQELLRSYLYGRANAIIVQTQTAAKFYIKKFKKSRVEVIGNPFNPITESRIVNENVILNIGRFIKSKNQEALIRIFSKLNKTDDWKLIIIGYNIGTNDIEFQLKEIAMRYGVGKNVIFAGKQKDVQSYYLKSKIFAFTSTSEGFPNVIGEAMAAGLPIISYDCVAGPSDLIEDGFNGFLIPLNDELLFLEKLQQMIENPELLNQFGSNSLFKVSEFEPSGIMQKFECFLTYKLKISDNE